MHFPELASIYSAEKKKTAIERDGKKYNSPTPSTKNMPFAQTPNCYRQPNKIVTSKIIQNTQHPHSILTKGNNKIIFTWIPSHVGINGNQEASKAVKDLTNTEIIQYTLEIYVSSQRKQKHFEILEQNTSNKLRDAWESHTKTSLKKAIDLSATPAINKSL